MKRYARSGKMLARSGMMHRLYLCLGYASLALGIAGIFLPVLPTTPFVLLAAWCFTRSNPALAAKLYNHPRFGPLLTAWRDQKAIPLQAKICALTMLALSYAVILHLAESRILPLILGAIMGSVALYIATRPRPRGRPDVPEPDACER
ncbi:YbaN family protein [Microvirga terrae]|uniref:YbaN family protein n=1 Tax=Microvirga terrae TaxID=2740529 RepID=A0ABY5RRT6_9HYPH|nr:YbaN family protein [Microvirga terrae]UVF19966.1 YbaN family protein [Microvirga terrae]